MKATSKLTNSQALGRAIAVILAGKGLSQKDLAEMAGVDQAFVSLIQAGKRSPSMKTLNRFSKVLKVPVGNLMILANKLEIGEWMP